MNEDTQLLLLAFLVFWTTLVILLIASKNKKKTLILHGTIHVVYSTCFLYGMYYHSQGGSGMLWWFYLLMALMVHWLINLGLLVYIRYNKVMKKNSKF